MTKKDAGICDNCTCAILHTDICIRCSIINVITAGDILWTKSSNSRHINTKDHTWQDGSTRDRSFEHFNYAYIAFPDKREVHP